MTVLENYDLTKLNTFGVAAVAKLFVEIESEADLSELLNSKVFKDNSRLFLGGGSNILFTKNFDGLVILNKLKGISVLSESDDRVLLKAMSGEVWHDLVLFATERKYWGIENLAFIPGTVGAAPVQNIGAYGADLAKVLESVEVFDIENGEKVVINTEDCRLGYRDSVFKSGAKGKYFISAVILKLSKIPKINTSYKILSQYLEENKINPLEPKDISEAVTAIRKSKLPDPKVIGNAGSFFKNVFIGKEKLEEMKQVHGRVSTFEEGGIIKVPAGWLVEQCGPADGISWKGYRKGNVGVYDKQALVLVNYGGATGQEIKNLASEIIDSVHAKFGLTLIPEVNFV